MENSYELQESDPNLLSEFEVHLVRAGSGKRLANLLIDVVLFYVLFFLFFALMPVLAGEIFLTPYLGRLLIMVAFGLYLSLFEMATKGKTLGKFITRTKAVQEDGSPITAAMAFSRGFSRVVPFEAFSALGSPPNPWHDKWSHTFVIDEAQSRQ